MLLAVVEIVRRLLGAAGRGGEPTLPVDVHDPDQCSEWKVQFMRQAVEQGILSEEQPIVMIWNMEELRQNFALVKSLFPAHAVHTMAAKANPLVRIMQVARDAGAGIECASIGELRLALMAGVPPSKIMFDSPCKTRRDIAEALAAGVSLNVDNFSELAHLAAARQACGPPAAGEWQPHFGIRINPEVGMGSIATHSTSSPFSKFAVGISQRAKLLQAYKEHSFLDMVHVHSGSQGMAVAQMVEGVRRAVDLALEVNAAAGHRQVRVLDLGGGLSVNFKTETYTPSIAEWVGELRRRVPELFDDTFDTIITELGRYYTAKAGFLASRVEYTKVAGGRNIALQHAGADILTRTIYHPTIWPLRLSVFSAAGAPKRVSPREYKVYDVGGPCCIAGDVCAHLRPLPPMEPGDFVVVHDVGGYYHASFSTYNVRAPPALYFGEITARGESQSVVFDPIQTGDQLERVLRFFQ